MASEEGDNACTITNFSRKEATTRDPLIDSRDSFFLSFYPTKCDGDHRLLFQSLLLSRIGPMSGRSGDNRVIHLCCPPGEACHERPEPDRAHQDPSYSVGYY